VAKFWECCQCKCAGVCAFCSWLCLRPNSERAPNVNAAFFTWPFLHWNCQSAPHLYELVFPHFSAACFCTQILRGHPMWMHWCCRIFYLVISAPKLSECGQCECTGVAAFFTWPFLRSNCHSAPNVNALVFPHFLVGYSCTHTFKVCLLSIRWCCCLFLWVISVAKF